jgi:hypothetical protein
LKDAIVSLEMIQGAGGYMQYWYQARNAQPSLSQMAQDFCSAPGLFSLSK